jgi:hypothetical protein
MQLAEPLIDLQILDFHSWESTANQHICFRIYPKCRVTPDSSPEL